MESKHQKLLADPDVKRWYNNVARGSLITADEKLRRLGRICEATGYTPKGLIDFKKGKPEEFDKFVMDYVDRLFSQNFKPAYVRNMLAGLKSWLAHNGLKIETRIKLPVADYAQERIPTKEELAQILRHCDSRTRVIASLMGFAGLRPESIGNYQGTDGLRLKDLPELKIRKKEVAIEKTPMILYVRPSLSKTRHQYFSFLPQEGCQYLKEYLELRLRDGEKLTPESPVVGHVRPGKLDFCRTTKLGYEVKKAITSAGFQWRPYVLRSYCAIAFDIAEARGFLSHPWRQFFMGHKGDIEARYSTMKQLPQQMIEEMRASYGKCEPLLSTVVQAADQLSTVKEAKIEALKSLAKSLLGIDVAEIKIAKEKEKKRELNQDETIELFEDEIKKVREQPDPQSMVDEKELQSYLHDGWMFVAVLPSGKIVVRK